MVVSAMSPRRLLGASSTQVEPESPGPPPLAVRHSRRSASGPRSPLDTFSDVRCPFSPLPRSEMIALRELVEVDELGVGLFGPAPWHLIELTGEHADGGRHADALRVEEAQRVLPVQTARGHAGVRHPGHRDVVEDLVPCEVADRM